MIVEKAPSGAICNECAIAGAGPVAAALTIRISGIKANVCHDHGTQFGRETLRALMTPQKPLVELAGLGYAHRKKLRK